jgi:hypothetical protein
MDISALRKYLHQQIDSADISVLNKIAAIVEDADFELSDELKKELDENYIRYKRGELQSFSFEEIETYLLSKHKKAV